MELRWLFIAVATVAAAPPLAAEEQHAACEFDRDAQGHYDLSPSCMSYLDSANSPSEKANRLFHVARDLDLNSNPAAARPLIDQAIELVPDKAEYLQERGYILSGYGQFEEALEDLDAAIALDPSYAQAYDNRAFSRDALGQFDGAVADLTKAIEFDGENPGRLIYRAVDLVWLGRLEEAEADLKRVEGTRGTADAVAYQRELIARIRDFVPRGDPSSECANDGRLADSSNASRIFDACTRAFLDATDNTDRARILTWRAYARAVLDNGLGRAIHEYQIITGLDPDFSEWRANYGFRLLDIRQPDAAIKAFDRAIELARGGESKAFALGGRAQAYYLANQPEKALADAEASLSAAKTPVPLITLGNLAFDKGAAEQAKRYWLDAWLMGMRGKEIDDLLAKAGVTDPQNEANK